MVVASGGLGYNDDKGSSRRREAAATLLSAVSLSRLVTSRSLRITPIHSALVAGVLGTTRALGL